MPAPRISVLKTSLSMQTDDASTPGPTYATPASSQSPWTVPSSPNGPCRIGSTTSTAPSVAGAESAGTGSVSAVVVPGSSARRSPGGSAQRPSRPISIVRTS